ncbi:MAG: hypothetical protein ACE5GN_05470, partial [Waddliaceae bacterium]
MGKLTKRLDRELTKQLFIFLEDFSPEQRKALRYDALHAHLIYNRKKGKKEASIILRSHLYYLEKQQELDSLAKEWLQLERQIKEVKIVLEGAAPEDRAEMQRMLQKAEESLVDLHASYGLICRMMKEDRLIAPVATNMIGTFRRQFDTLNSLLALIHQPLTGKKYTHIVSGDHFSDFSRGCWPTKDDCMTKEQLFEGRDIEGLAIGDEPITIPTTVVQGEPPIARQPRIVVFKCDVGSGHISATKALAQSLPDCDIQVADVYGDILAQLDAGGKVSPELSQQNVANYLAKNEYYRAMNFAENFADIVVNEKKKKQMEALIEEYVRKENPDMLVSTITLLNGVFVNVGKKLGIPVRVVAPDIGIEHFTRGLTEEQCEYEHFRMTFAYDRKEAKELLGSGVIGGKIPRNLLDKIDDNVGAPVRFGFNLDMSPEVLNKLRSKYQIQEDENVILVSVGGNTTKAALDYAELLTQMSDEQLDRISKQSDRKKFRLICLCGDSQIKENKKLQDKLNAMNGSKGRNDRVTICAVERTTRIPELESLPEMFTLIGKGGGGTVTEAIKKGVPQVYHVASTPLKWELMNMLYGEKKGYGKRFKIPAWKFKMEAVREELATILAQNMETRRKILDGTREVKESKLNFTKNIRELIRGDLKRRYESAPLYLPNYPGFGTPIEKSESKAKGSVLSRIRKIVLRIVFVGVSAAGGALTFTASPLVGLAAGGGAAVAILATAKLVSYLYNRVHSGRKYRVKLPVEVVKHNTREGPKPGEETTADVRVINEAELSFEWKKR